MYNFVQVVEHDFGFKLTWGSPFKAEIVLTKTSLKDKVCGLCGNANADPDDDFTTPQLQQVLWQLSILFL